MATVLQMPTMFAQIMLARKKTKVAQTKTPTAYLTLLTSARKLQVRKKTKVALGQIPMPMAYSTKTTNVRT
jgi:hypothetical protein